jgi:hypothetical protein
MTSHSYFLSIQRAVADKNTWGRKDTIIGTQTMSEDTVRYRVHKRATREVAASQAAGLNSAFALLIQHI